MQGTASDHIRNFCVIAHIDHGKSTLADRLIEHTGAYSARSKLDQVLDNMDIERERGITIKARAVRMEYKAADGSCYVYNLIDTPGHVDFNYEVSRSLAACDGAILIVDASQGVEAQTLANAYLAIDAGLEVLPVINKIDLPAARPEEVRHEIEEVIGLDASHAPLISAKNDVNIDQVLEAVKDYLPPPTGDRGKPLRALIFDSLYDAYLGVIAHVNVREGQVSLGDEILMMHSKKQFTVTSLGTFSPTAMVPGESLCAGDVGYITASIKNVRDTAPGDTITLAESPAPEPLPGYQPVRQMVFCGMYPVDGADYPDLRDALERLQLNDAALSFEPETSTALGFGFRCGFLGLLHYEIIQERLEREFDLDLISTAPSVAYRLNMTDGSQKTLENPTNMPGPEQIASIEEPVVSASIMLPKEYIGNVMELCHNYRGVYVNTEYVDENRVNLHYDMPLNEIIYDFFDALKSNTKGYASLDYEFKGWQVSDLVKLDMMINGEQVDALTFILHRDDAYKRGRAMAEKLRDNIPRQQFEIPIQASVGGRIIARETVRAYRKDVTAKCYGGDITRKKKLLEKQKEGKKRMRQVGSVEVPQEAFMSVLRLSD
ncbi:MAG TPA: translation elongation factor 4 [Bacillota bacterium]|jgi:GTP-binding protein LepA|nr:elongation factor 4 [Fastidiosipila sp.]HPX93695.1 translation elongation factor 4 [Bacillota bacterium]HQB81401.1 translation elongation factor 4 [Bacillota bacterium]